MHITCTISVWFHSTIGSKTLCPPLMILMQAVIPDFGDIVGLGGRLLFWDAHIEICNWTASWRVTEHSLKACLQIKMLRHGVRSAQYVNRTILAVAIETWTHSLFAGVVVSRTEIPHVVLLISLNVRICLRSPEQYFVRLFMVSITTCFQKSRGGFTFPWKNKLVLIQTMIPAHRLTFPTGFTDAWQKVATSELS